jgi:hypothetical protein
MRKQEGGEAHTLEERRRKKKVRQYERAKLQEGGVKNNGWLLALVAVRRELNWGRILQKASRQQVSLLLLCELHASYFFHLHQVIQIMIANNSLMALLLIFNLKLLIPPKSFPPFCPLLQDVARGAFKPRAFFNLVGLASCTSSQPAQQSHSLAIQPCILSCLT